MKTIRFEVEKEVSDETDISAVSPDASFKVIKRHEVTFLGFSVFFHENLQVDEKKPPIYNINLHLGPRGSDERTVAVTETPEISAAIAAMMKELKKSL